MIQQEQLANGVFNMTINDQEFFTRGELAKLFRVTQQTVIRWEAAGLLKSIHLGSGAVRYSRSEVTAFLSRQSTARPTRPARCVVHES
jgi:predicted site-specific integrase-resolvase